MQDQRQLSWLLPSQPTPQGLGAIGSLFGFGPPYGGPQQYGPRPPIGPPGFGQDGPPPGPPPGRPPLGVEQEVGVFAVDPGAFRRCLYRYTYVILDDGRRFWFWPTFIGRTSVAGYRWRPRQFRWVYMGLDTRLIRSFQCR
ncbi:hypothetical protein [Salipaludibacillus daqingensis]|uniref:hypothetical protein n=1 Tax=Salipaludibacillus daqingensis TaxID=3041001 RepID=UPI00247646E1|nr:hypothetical protein [Salipaludibacillus daqingensis]